MTSTVSAARTSLHTLWGRLLEEIGDIFDAHGVCATVGAVLADHTGLTTVVALANPVGDLFDVWVADPDGNLTQARWTEREAAISSLFNGDQPVLKEKVRVAADEVVRSMLWQLASDSVLAVPLPYPAVDNRISPPGAICLVDPDPDGPLDLGNIGLVGSQVTIYLDRAFLRQRSDQQTIEFGIISDISYSITSTLDLEEIFLEVTDAVRRALGAESISIGLTDPSGTEIVFVEKLMGPIFRDLPPLRLKMGQGVAGWVAQHGEATIVNDPYGDSRFFSKIDRDSGFRTQSIICVPLQIEQRVIGVLEAINKLQGHFDDNDLRLLQAISGPLGVAIENARLHADVLSEKRRVETIFASMSEGLLTANAQGEITAANDALLTLLRNSQDDLAGRPLSKVIQTRPAAFEDFVKEVIQAEDEFPQVACDLVQVNGETVPVLISGTTIHQVEGENDELIFVFSDLRQIREVERMRDDFFSNIIHELRTPLATILMYARLLREGKAEGDPEKAKRFLGVIERESDRLQKMIRQMLQVAKMEASEFHRSAESVMLGPIFEQLLPPLADRATEKGLTFRQHVPEDLPPVMGTEETLYMIFKNLVENSIKFTLSGSVGVDVTHDDHTVQVSVSDDGIGIPREAMPNLFRRFYRTQTAVERGIAGSGLGLYMVREALKMYGGEIEVTSEEGLGTTFTVRLPVAPT